MAGKAASSHNHDSIYYHKIEVDAELAKKAALSHNHPYLPLSGGHMTGDIFMNGNTIYCSQTAGVHASGNTLHLRSESYLNLRSPGIQCRDATDSLWAGISASGFHTQSSRRYKENINPITDDRAKCILDIGVVIYDYKDGVVQSDEQYNRSGVIAEDTAEIIPEVVLYREIDRKKVPDGVDYAKFVPYLIRMVQLQQQEIDSLKEFLHLSNK